MDDIKKLAAEIDADRVREARRRQPPEAGFLDAARMFDVACRRMLVGLRMDFPDADEPRLHELLREQLRRLRALEERGLYQSFESPDGQ